MTRCRRSFHGGVLGNRRLGKLPDRAVSVLLIMKTNIIRNKKIRPLEERLYIPLSCADQAGKGWWWAGLRQCAIRPGLFVLPLRSRRNEAAAQITHLVSIA